MTYYFDTHSSDPFYNLAFEEYFFNKKKDGETYLILWQNADTVVVGRYQNIYQEIDLNYARENDIKIVRRNSGGGSVFHDIGNLNFSVVYDFPTSDSIEDILKPFISTLCTLGVNPKLHGRNDIFVNGYKISGLAQYIRESKILYHGTLLVNSDLSKIEKVLTRNSKIFDSLSYPSKKSAVCNLCDVLNEKISISEIKKLIISNYEFISDYNVSETEKAEINKLAQSKYKKDEWNYGYMPEFNFVNKKRFKGGTVEVNAIIENNCIKQLEFRGDFFAKKDINELEQIFENIDLSEDLQRVINKIEIEEYINDVYSSDILSLFDAYTGETV